MRIVQVSPWFYPHLGGVESHVLGLSRELAARGHEVTVVTARHTSSAPERESVDGFDIVRVKPRMVVLRTPIAPRMRTVLRGLTADVVHAHLPPPLSAHYAADVCEQRGTPLVVTYHCDVEIPSVVGSFIETLYRRSLGASTLRRAAKVIVTTKTYAATSRSVWRHNPVVIPNAVDVHRFHPDVDGSAVRARLKIPPGRPIVLLVGRIVPHKGVEHFIEAARYLSGVQLLVAGEGSSLESMERLARSLGVKDRILFLGRVSQENLPKVYAVCDVFVLPSVSRLEAFGIVALEAMATGKAVVVADIPGVREVIEDGKEGLLADPVNPQDLAEKIRRLIENPTLRAEMGRRAREKVLARFTTETVADQILQVYADVRAPRTSTGPR
ncbi:MAG TPA: glycosyltransferase family 4 protein [Thermoplasmata archaeon]|nr:glycosyltransferase family 4 protein [Thermoplasmata archaeon]